MKHWTRFLPEFGRSYITDSIEKKMAEVKNLKLQIDSINQDIRELERELLNDYIKPNWTDLEIKTAKKSSHEQK